MRVVRWTALFLRPEGRRDSAPLFEGWVGCSAVGAAWLVQHFALLPDKGGILFPKRIPPLEPPEKGEGRPPRPPTLWVCSLKGCTRCAVQVRCTWLRHGSLRFVTGSNRALLRGARVTFIRRQTACAAAALLRSPPAGEMVLIRGSICGEIAALRCSPPLLGFC